LYIRSTILSLQKNAPKFITAAMPSARVMPVCPPRAFPMKRKRPVSAPRSSVVFIVFIS
jgi:hypothetical protein